MATYPEPKTLLDGLTFAEGPRWHEGRLWFSDMPKGRVVAVGLDGKAETIAQLPERASGLGWLPDGRLLVVAMHERQILRQERDGSLVVHADLSSLAPGHCNDMVVDGRGNAYVGNFGFAMGEPRRNTVLILATPDGKTRVVADDLGFPNGCAITPDRKTLIVAETFGRQLSAFDVEDDGSLTNGRVYASLGSHTPDGIALDAEGGVWFGTTEHSYARAMPGVGVVDVIETPGRMGIACALGGPDRKTLFLASAYGERTKILEGGTTAAIETVPVQVAGAGWP